ncbi:MAG: efflux RND transporter periplasmic adaptor subunit [Nevskiaceae bacterium]|nr:efflux RND transporter periplasmic adaptor subunit [Nevskiaceae bacterium]
MGAVALVFVALRVIRGSDASKVTYELAAVDRGTVERSINSSGAVAALVTVEIGSQISGQIAELNADFNTQVKKGDLLAIIDPQTYRSRVLSAEADLAVANATLGTQKANLEKARTTLAQAKRDYERQQQLAQQQLIAVAEVETGRKTVELAEGDVAIAEAQVRNSTAAIQTRQASLDQARIDLSRTEIRSPIDGIVIQRAVDLGQTVAASLQAPVLFKIAQDMSQIQIEAHVDEADIGSIQPENEATFTVDAFPNQTFRGNVFQVRLAATNTQNVVTYSVMVHAPNPRQMLLPGMTANVRIITDRRDDVLRVPNDASRFQPTGASPAAAQQGGQGGQGGGMMMQGEMMAELGLTPEQQEKMQKAFQELTAQMQAQNQGAAPAIGGGGGGGFRVQIGGGNNQQAQAMRNRIENMMSSILTPEQLEKFRQMRGRGGQRAAARAGTLWTLDRNTPVEHQVRLGVSDDRYTEVVDGDVKEGDQVIVRSRTEVRK